MFTISYKTFRDSRDTPLYLKSTHNTRVYYEHDTGIQMKELLIETKNIYI